MNKQVHIVPRANGWAVKNSNASRASSLHDRKIDACAAGRNSAIKQHAELYVHNKDGRIGYKNSYGNDSFPPRG